MSDPFSSEYVSNTITGATKKDTPVLNKLTEISQVATVAAISVAPEFGFEPQRYGLGKPKRVIIRGTITRG